MTKEKLRLKHVPFLIFTLLMIPVLTIALLFNMSMEEPVVEDNNFEEVEDTLPVINTTVKPINPYTDQKVKVGKTYYDYKAEEQSQLNSIIKHDNTYIQNTGMDFVGEDIFDVVSILDGTVEKVSDDDTLGKVIEIKHNDGNISVYQSLSEVYVKKGDMVNQGQQIGKSGTNALDKDLGNHLHFEIYSNGDAINPEIYLKTEQKTKKEN